MPTFRRIAHAVILLHLIASTIWASSLEWERREASLTASPRQEKIELSFAFTNSGAVPVTIKSAKPSCDCTVAELGKKTYAPSESGELKVVYKIEGKVGKRERTITIETDEPGEPTVLTLKVDIPELVEVKPRLLVWRAGDTPDEKAVDIFLATDPAMSLTDATSSDPAVTLRVETVVPFRQFRLWVKPRSTQASLRSTIHVTTMAAELHQDYHFIIYAQIR